MEDREQNIYITAAAQISVQEPLCDQWIDKPIFYTEPYQRAIEADYKPFLDPVSSRRMGKILKRAMATSLTVSQQSGIECPDAIITGTGLGCIENTEKFLTAMVTEGEDFLQPTNFINSTHNTISSQIAVRMKCHGYNSTYVHLGVSFESALLDAFMQFQTGRIKSALVGGHDEMTPNYFSLLNRVGFWEDAMAGETAVSFMLSNTLPTNPVQDPNRKWRNPRLRDIALLFKPTNGFLEQQAACMCAKAGRNILNVPRITPEKVERIFGRSFTSGAFGMYMAAAIISAGRADSFLVFNNYHGEDASVMLITL